MLSELLRLSHPMQTQYLPLDTLWEDGTGKQTLHAAVFREAGSALGRPGLLALKQLLGQRVQLLLEDIFTNMRTLDPGAISPLLYKQSAQRDTSKDCS